MKSLVISVCLLALVLSIAPVAARAAEDQSTASPRLILVHYMPWFEADAAATQWGWHWTMNKYDPSVVNNGHREIASKYYPAIGPYDSSDPHVFEYHLLLMKIAGIDGVIIDWYGIRDLWDYGVIHRNTALLVEQARSHGLKVAICYEDRTIPNLVKENRIAAGERVCHAVEVVDWFGKHWFPMEHHVRVQQYRRRHVEPGFAATAADLELPRRLLELRRTTKGADEKERFDRIADLVRQGHYDAARAELTNLATKLGLRELRE
jgi:hypothetical protein